MKIEVTLIETVVVQRKVKYTVQAENEQEILNKIDKSVDYMDILEVEGIEERDISVPVIKDILKAKVIEEPKIEG